MMRVAVLKSGEPHTAKPVTALLNCLALLHAFEFKPGELTGAKLIELADPQPRATHVSLSGSRGGAPYNLYLPMNDFKALRLENGDQIRFLADRPGDTIMVEARRVARCAATRACTRS